MLTIDRWDFWEQILRWIGGQNELKQKTRDEAQTLEQLMQSIQQRSREKESAT